MSKKSWAHFFQWAVDWMVRPSPEKLEPFMRKDLMWYSSTEAELQQWITKCRCFSRWPELFYHFKLPFRSSFCESSLRNCRALSVAFSLRIVILGDLRGDTWAQFFLGRWSSPWKEIERLYDSKTERQKGGGKWISKIFWPRAVAQAVLGFTLMFRGKHRV